MQELHREVKDMRTMIAIISVNLLTGPIREQVVTYHSMGSHQPTSEFYNIECLIYIAIISKKHRLYPN